MSIRRKWGAALGKGGWGAPGWPVEYGGLDLSLECQVVVMEELVRAGAPEALNSNGLGIFGPILIRHGSQDQRLRLLPSMLDHSKLWCQGFSEPGAGSDLAALGTRARPEGEKLVVSGQKVWTSFASHADYCYALVRTDPEAPKRDGISMIVIEMDRPGITIRPLRNIAGGAEFAEVFFDDVEVPAENVIGEMNRGWPMAVEALSLERGLSFAERSLRLSREVQKVARLLATAGPPRADAGERERAAERIFDLYLESRQLSSTVRRVIRLSEAPERVGVIAALAKLRWSELHQALLDLAVESLGTAAGREGPDEWLRAFLFSRGETIYAGTSEIQRNTIARAIGMPTSSPQSANGPPARPRVRAGGLAVDADQEMLREGLDDLLGGLRRGIESHPALADDPGEVLDEIWRQVAEGGWLEVADGAGADLPRTLVALGEAVGARLLTGAFGVTATLAVPLLRRADERGTAADLGAVLSGEALATVVLPDGGSPAAPLWEGATAQMMNGELCIAGRSVDVPFAADSTWLLVPVETERGLTVAVVPRDADGLSVGAPHGVDRIKPLADVTFEDVRVGRDQLLDGGGDMRSDLEERLAHYLLFLDGEALGGAQEALKRTIAYTAERRQFGVPVGSFQALKHLVADAYGELEFARGHAYDVGATIGAGGGLDLASLACSRLTCARMYPRVLATCIQAHGGAGFTWEQEIHLWYRAALQQRVHPFAAGALRVAGRRAFQAATATDQETDREGESTR